MTDNFWQEMGGVLFEEAGDALFLFDPDSEQLCQVNPMAQRLSGFSRRELLEMKITYLVRSEAEGGLNRVRLAFRRTGLFHSQEGFWLRNKGTGGWVPINLTITRLHTGSKAFGLITARDITERRDAHARLQEAEAELRRVLNSVSDCLWSAEISAGGKWAYRFISPVVERITGRPPDFYFSGPDKWLSAVHPEDQARILEAQEGLRAGNSAQQEYRIVCPDGTVRWVRDSIAATMGGPDGQTVRLDGVLSDITERKRGEEALRTSESRHRVLMQQIPAIVWTMDTDLRIQGSVGAGLASIAEVPDQFAGKTLYQALGNDDPAFLPIAAHLQALKGTAVSYEMEHRGRNWHTHVEPLHDPEGKTIGVIGLCLDITERQRAENELRESQRVLATLMSNLPGMAYRSRNDPNWTMQFASEGALELTGYKAEDLIGNHKVSYAALIHPDDRGPVRDAVQAALAENRPFRLLYRLRTAKDEEKWISEQGRGVLSADGSLLALEGFITDTTERKNAEEALRGSEAKYRTLIENLSQCIFLKDREFRFVAVNEPFCRALGRPAEDFIGKTDFDFFPRSMADNYRAADQLVLKEQRRLEIEEQNLQQGKMRTVQTVKTPVLDGQGQAIGVLGIFWDVTDQRNFEAQLRQAHKMEAVGQLAGGIAHDFNNLLTGILGNLALALADLPEGHACRELLASAEVAGMRAAELTRQLLGFSRRTPLIPRPVDLNGCIEETVRLVRRTFDPRVTVTLQCAANLWPAQADAGQMGQVIMNLCLNARDALRSGGTLTLQTANVRLAGEDARRFLEGRPGDFVHLCVRDNGCGIPAEVQDRIFEPFFTTKEPGKGTGLGLAMVFGIVKQHQGWIECHSEVGQGTRFDVFLPRLPDSSAIPPPSPTPATSRGGHETILLADDEEVVGRLGQIILERHGYRVLKAVDGVEAVEIYRKQSRDIDLVILDLSMPRLSGPETLRELRKINSSVSVLISSGYSSEEDMRTVERQGVAGFVAKPYRPAELARCVRAALDAVRGDLSPASD